jgi:YNFM family putative membrane transporter
MFTYVFIPLFALSIDLGLKEVALLMALMHLPLSLSFVISELTDGAKRMNVIAIGLFIGGISFILLSVLVTQLWVAILAALTMLSLAIIRPAYNGMITLLTPRRYLGEVTSLNNVSLRLGYVVGPVLSGLIADRYSIQVAFLVIAIFAFILAILALFFKGFEVLQAEA